MNSRQPALASVASECDPRVSCRADERGGDILFPLGGSIPRDPTGRFVRVGSPGDATCAQSGACARSVPLKPTWEVYEMLLMVRRIVQQVGLRRVQKELSSLSLRSIQIVPERTASALLFHLQYTISVQGDHAVIPAMDARASPGEVVSVRVLRPCGKDPADVPVQFVAPKSYLFPKVPGETWDGAIIQCTIRLDPTESTNVLSFPEHLPVLLTGRTEGPQPRLHWLDPDRACEPLSGIPYPNSEGEREWLQLVVGTAREIRIVQHPHVVIVGRWARVLRLGEQQRVDRLFGRILASHARILGTTLSNRVVVMSRQEAFGQCGILMPLNRLEALGFEGADPAYVLLGSRMASAWWGTAVRLTGAGKDEIAATIRALAGVRLVQHLAVAGEDELLKRMEIAAEQSRLVDWWQGQQGRFRLGYHGRISLALFRAPSLWDFEREMRMMLQTHFAEFLPAERIRLLLDQHI